MFHKGADGLVFRNRLPLHLGAMKRHVFVLCLAAATALGCVNVSDNQALLPVVAPILDSVFVGDTLPARSVFLRDQQGGLHDPGTVRWQIVPTSVATIDSVTGKIVGVSKGSAVVLATVSGVTSPALVVVSRPLEMTLLLDTIYLMPSDTITVPLVMKQKTAAPLTLRFDTSATPSVYTIDTLSGVVTAHTNGVVRYVARLTDGMYSVADTGAVGVMSLADTLGNGKYFMTAFGTAIRHQTGGALAVNYRRTNGHHGFRLLDTLTSSTVDERVLITLPDSALGTGPALEIDSISPAEVAGSAGDPGCSPPRPWALWASVPADPQRAALVAYAHGTPSSAVAGELIITSYVTAASGGAIIGGRYFFQARRGDLYGDPLGAEMIQGTFVAPLRERHSTC